MKARAICCRRQPPTRGGKTVSMAKDVLPPHAPTAAFTSRHCTVFCIDVSVSCDSFPNCKSDFQLCVKRAYFRSLTNTQRTCSDCY